VVIHCFLKGEKMQSFFDAITHPVVFHVLALVLAWTVVWYLRDQPLSAIGRFQKILEVTLCWAVPGITILLLFIEYAGRKWLFMLLVVAAVAILAYHAGKDRGEKQRPMV